MVLCIAQTKEDGTEAVKFVVLLESAQLGETVTFEGLPKPITLSASQVEKRKVFENCLGSMKTDADGCATWNGHKFIVGDGGEYCKLTICNGPVR